MNPREAIAAMLKQRIGLNEQSVGVHGIEQALRRRMSALRLDQAEAYWRRLQESEIEFRDFVNEIVIAESWFFRDLNPFQLLVSHLLEKARANGPKESWRILSAPCATGEEPYSIAMMLIEAGFRTHDFVIDAVDISEKLLAIARQLSYRASSLRGIEARFQKRFFQEPKAGEFLLSAEVREPVRFSQGNIVERAFGEGRGPYDAIFCRNLLIYLDEPARRQVVAHLDRLLVPGGLLVVGHAEAAAVTVPHFQPSKVPGAFAFFKSSAPEVQHPRPRVSHSPANFAGRHDSSPRKAPPPEAAIQWKEPLTPALSPSGQERKSSAAGGLPGSSAPEAWSSRGSQSTGRADPADEGVLDKILSLADSGKLPEASALCRRYLEARPSCPRALYLLGVVQMASGKAQEAEGLFNQVVYLAPEHTEAMMHLAHLAESRGEAGLAGRWRERLVRILRRTIPG